MQATELARSLQLRRYARHWRGRCPSCAYPGNTFSLRDRLGWLGVFCANGCTRKEIGDAMRLAMGATWDSEFAAPKDEDSRRARSQERALRLWRGSEPVAGTPAARYLVARGVRHLAQSIALRYRGDCPHPERTRLPALVAAVTDESGAVVGVHRTFVRRDGSGKASVEPNKASIGPIWGGAIRLFPVAEHLVIGEGIETAASAGVLLGLPAWAAISAGNLARGLVLPPEVCVVTIAADPDKAGRQAARVAWSRWTAAGRRVRVAVPDGSGDFNDVLRAREGRDG
jgi:putative DNA primase/helicase